MDDIKVSGVNIDASVGRTYSSMIFMQNSGQVGAAPKLRIRGTSTVLGNREPLAGVRWGSFDRSGEC